jgi:hypothetical protein
LLRLLFDDVLAALAPLQRGEAHIPVAKTPESGAFAGLAEQILACLERSFENFEENMD